MSDETTTIRPLFGVSRPSGSGRSRDGVRSFGEMQSAVLLVGFPLLWIRE